MERQTEQLVRSCGFHRVLKIVRVCIAFFAEIEPGMRILVSEQRVVTRDVFDALEVDPGPCPGVPRVGRDWMRWRADRQKIDHHQFAVVVPAGREKAGFRMPTHGKRLASIQHPWPVHTLVDPGSKIVYLLISEMAPSRENAA